VYDGVKQSQVCMAAADWTAFPRRKLNTSPY
jgi:hypothetical protein